MNLLFYHYSLQAGGAERAISLLSNYAVRQGDAVTIFLEDNKPPFYPLDPRIHLLHLNTARSSSNKWDAVKNNLRATSCFRNALRDCSPDVILCFGSGSSIILQVLLVKKRRCKVIGSERSNPLLQRKGLWFHLSPWLSTKCDGFIFQTTGARSCFPRKTQARSVILQNSVDSPEFEQAERPWNTRSGICAVGRFVSVKCFDDLLRVFAIVHKKIPEAHLDLYGDGPGRKSLEELANALDLGSSLTFCGNNQKIISEYAKHKIFVMTSKSEGMPTVLLEAMASGCACVSTDCNFGPSDLIRDGENGFLVPVHDIDAAADRLCRLLEDDALSRRLGDAAKSIRETNSAEKLGGAFRTYVQQIIHET